MNKVAVIFTCFNRKEKTKKSIIDINKLNPNSDFTFVVVDDGSTDGTKEVLHELSETYRIHTIHGPGDLYYAGGMRVGMNYILQELDMIYDYLLMINDDVEFVVNSIEKCIEQSKGNQDAVIVGATCDSKGQLSYSGVKYYKGIKYRKIDIDENKVEADTFNANMVLIPFGIFQEVGIMDSEYRHALGDFDYGFMIRKAGYTIYVSNEYVGMCNNNPNEGTWLDKSLGIWQRMKKKESIKGAPFKQWFYFLNKNFGLIMAIRYSVTPYIRILLRR